MVRIWLKEQPRVRPVTGGGSCPIIDGIDRPDLKVEWDPINKKHFIGVGADPWDPTYVGAWLEVSLDHVAAVTCRTEIVTGRREDGSYRLDQATLVACTRVSKDGLIQDLLIRGPTVASVDTIYRQFRSNSNFRPIEDWEAGARGEIVGAPVVARDKVSDDPDPTDPHA